MRKSTSAFATLLFLVSSAVPARAGGVVLDLDREFYVPGDVVRAHESVWLKSSMGRLRDGPYFAYLSELTKRMPPPLPPDAVRVAPVEVEPRPTGEHGDASVEFVLPPVEPGRYWLTLCNDPCTQPLGDVMATPLIAAASVDDGRIMAMRDRLSERIRGLRILLGSRVLGHRGDSLRGRITSLEREVASLTAQVDELRAAAERPRPDPESDRRSALPALLAFAVPAAVLGVVLGRRSRAT